MTRKTSNRFAMLNYFIDETASEVSRMEACVWFCVYRWARNGKKTPCLWEASVSQRQIAKAIGSPQQSVSRCIQSLVKKGLLVRTKNGSQTWKSSRYLVYPDVDKSRYVPPGDLTAP